MDRTYIDQVLMDKIAVHYEDIENKLFSGIRRKALNNTDFSIISNNCWGGHVYRRFGIPYSSPTVGLYFYADEYIKFLNNLRDSIFGNIDFITPYESKYSSDLLQKKQDKVIIGVINGEIEIVFLHYHSETEVIEKWKRRAERVNFNNLIVKFSQMNNCSIEHIRAFANLDYQKKILLLANSIPGIEGYCVKRYTSQNQVVDDTTYYAKHAPLKKIINNSKV